MHLVRRAAQLAFHILLLNFNFVNFLGFQQCLPVYIFIIVKPVNGTRRTHRCPWCLCRALLARQRHLSQTLIRLDTLKGSTFRRRWGRGRREIARVNRISIFFLLHIYHLRPARYIKCQYSKQTSIRTRAYSWRRVANYLWVQDFDLCERRRAGTGRTGNHTSNLLDSEEESVHCSRWGDGAQQQQHAGCHCPFQSIFLYQGCLIV